jgi:hypothetical protein
MSTTNKKTELKPARPLGMARAKRAAQFLATAIAAKELPAMQIGSFTLTRLADGVFWLVPSSGEGMATSTAKLEAVLREYWRKEF